MAKDKKKKEGLSPKVYSGLSKKRMEKGTGGVRTVLKQGETVTGMIMDAPDDMREYDEHQFSDKGRWYYVPCAGDNCPLCQDDDSDVSKLHYKCITNFYNYKTKKVEVLSGPKDLAGRMTKRFETLFKRASKKSKGKKAAAKLAISMWLGKVWEVSKYPTTPVSYDVEESDDDPIKLSPEKHKRHDLDAYIAGELKRYFGDEMPKGGSKSSLDDDDDVEEDDAYDEDDLEEMSPKEIKRIARGLDIKTKDADGDPVPVKKLIKKILKKQ